MFGLWDCSDCTRPPRRHKHFSGPQRSCPKTARLVPIARLLCRHATRSRPLLRSDQGARHAFRRRVLRGRFDDRHLLPARLHRAHAGSRPVHLLCERRQRRGRRISALPALPPRTRAGFRADGLGAARLPARRRTHRGRIPVRRRHGRPGRRVFAELAPAAPRRRTRIRRYAGGTRADAPAAARQTTAHRHAIEDGRRRIRERLFERTAFQSPVSNALWPEPDGDAPRPTHHKRAPAQSRSNSAIGRRSRGRRSPDF